MIRASRACVCVVNTYYPLLPLLFPQPDELLVLPRDKVDCGVLQQGGKHKEETHRHPNVNGLHIRHLGRDTSQSVGGLMDNMWVIHGLPGPARLLRHALTHILGNTGMTYNESVGCERLTHSHGMSHECDPEERPGRAAREGSHVKVDQGRIVWEFLPMNQGAVNKSQWGKKTP